MKKTISCIISIAVLAGLVVGGLRIIRYLDTDDTGNSYAWTRMAMHQLYHSDSNIDILFVGSSNTERGLNPEIADDIFGEYTFNGASSTQRKDGSYAVIKEAVAHHDISQIYLDMGYSSAWKQSYKDRTELTGTYIISDYIRNPIHRAAYLLNASSPEYYVNGFIPARRNWKTLLDFSKVKELVATKRQDAYRNYEYVPEEGNQNYYVDRGYLANDSMLANDEVVFFRPYGEIGFDNVSQDWLDSVYDIANLCKKNGIELIFYTAPRHESVYIGGNYDEYVAYINQLAEQLGVKFYDFNLCKSEYFDATDWNFYLDGVHLNTAGGEQFTEVFSRFFVGEIAEEDLFYSSFEEKVASEATQIVGMLAQEDGEDSELNQVHIIANRETGLEYKIVFRQDDGEVYEVQDFSENRGFTLPKDASGVIEIEWREQGDSKGSHVEEYSYN